MLNATFCILLSVKVILWDVSPALHAWLESIIV